MDNNSLKTKGMDISFEPIEDDFYYCRRCEIYSKNSENSMIPCPRGSCEARIIGTAITTTLINQSLTKEQEEWNKKNGR